MPRLPRQIARNSDPSTSHEAAATLNRTGGRLRMRDIAKNLVARYPDHTANELEELAGYTNGQIRKRLNDLLHAGEVIKSGYRICRKSQSRSATWRVVQQDS